MIDLHETALGTTFAVKVQPRAKKNAILGDLGGALKISLAAPPVDGRANEACVEFLAELLNVPLSAVTIVSGETSRRKVVRVGGISPDSVRDKLRL
ncbi:MAG: DUF167 domain-containing protein [Acidobacteria bacterium]|nr:DUF167 domain-containing protein [Acidobacteriota bacterium]